MYSRRGKDNLKILTIGDAGVGKTSLLKMYVTGKFSTQYRVTLGADFLSKKVEIGSKTLNLHLVDTAGQEKFNSLGNAFYKGADCCVLVFDITSEKSFQSLDTWKEVFIENGLINDTDSFPFVVLANKADKESERKVSKEQAMKWVESQEGNVEFFETSAKNGDAVEEAFNKVALMAKEYKGETEYTPPPVVNLRDAVDKGGSGKTGGRRKNENIGCC
jgi:Ras-related protein Rab-7A